MKNGILLSLYNGFVCGLSFLARLANRKFFSMQKSYSFKSAIRMTGICLVIAAFIFMMFFSCLLFSNAFADFFVAVLILCVLAIGGVWIVAQEVKSDQKNGEGNLNIY